MNSESYLGLPEIGDVPAFPVSELKKGDWNDGTSPISGRTR